MNKNYIVYSDVAGIMEEWEEFDPARDTAKMLAEIFPTERFFVVHYNVVVFRP